MFSGVTKIYQANNLQHDVISEKASDHGLQFQLYFNVKKKEDFTLELLL